MMKRIGLVVMVMMLGVSVGVVQAAGSTPLKLSLVSGVGIPANPNVVGVDLGILAAGSDNVTIIQYGLFAAISHDTMYGLQSAFAHASCEGKMHGIQDAFAVCSAKHACGLQIALVNRAEDMYGIQLGLVNIARRLHGVQIGLINVIREGKLPVMVLVNASF